MLSRDEAATSLKDIQRTQGRSAEAYGYASAAPFLILWGAIWFLGYGATDFGPPYSNWVWPVLILIGLVASAVVGMRTKSGNAKQGVRIMAMWLVMLAYASAVLAVMRPVNDNQVGAFFPLIVAFLYTMMGIWMGLRFVIAGVAIAALTLGGYFLLASHFSLWMAFVGGGTLIATGLWLRKA